jgi:patched 1 protein
MVTLVVILAGSVWGITKVTDGLDLTDIVPQNTDEHAFLSAQGKYFGFYNMYAVTQGEFEYPTNQKLLYEYHEAFMRVPNIIKNDDGGLPEFWLSLFRDWLIGKTEALLFWSNKLWTYKQTNKQTLWPLASKLYLLSNRHLLAKFSANFCG